MEKKIPELTATVTGTIGKDTVEYTLSRKAGEDVGTYTITPSGKAEQTNYKVTYATGTLTITKAETMTLTPELTGKDAEKEYDSKPLSGGATASEQKEQRSLIQQMAEKHGQKHCQALQM